MARASLDDFASHGALQHSRDALWHAAALGTHGTVAGLQAVGAVAGAGYDAVQFAGNLPANTVAGSIGIMNSLAGAAVTGGGQAISTVVPPLVSGTGQLISGTGQVIAGAARGTASGAGQVISGTGQVIGAAARQTARAGRAISSAASSSSGRWQESGPSIWRRIADPMIQAAVESAA